MCHRRVLFAKVFCIALAIPLLLWANSAFPPAAHTGGFGEPNCTACHTGSANPPGGSVSIDAPATYTPGQTVPIRVVIQDSAGGRILWGFELSARFRNRQQAGSFTPGGVVRVETAGGVQYATHNGAQRQPGNGFTYTVNWTAPVDASGGEVIFNAAANAANNSGTESGDRIFTAERVSAAPSTAPARIGSGGIVSAATFVQAPNNIGSPGMLVSIFGENMSTNTVQATSLPLPTQLDGTTVLMNNVAAPLIFVSAGQINAQVPFEVTPGSSVNVVVTRPAGQTSAPEPLRIEDVAPGIFTIPSAGTGTGAILHANSSRIVGSNDPARPGNFVSIFATGLGRVNPPLDSGAAGNAQETLVRPTVTIGGRDAPVQFSGAAPGFAGLYQINVIVPSALSAGNHDIIITQAGRQSRSGVTIAIQP